MMSRADRTVLSEWWWTVDRALLASLIGLMVIGIILCLAASPAVAARLNIPDPFHFVNCVIVAEDLHRRRKTDAVLPPVRIRLHRVPVELVVVHLLLQIRYNVNQQRPPATVTMLPAT